MKFGLFSVADYYPDRHGRSQAACLAEWLAQAELAEALGFHSFWVAEHHFSSLGLVANPAVFLAAAAARTGRIRLGCAVSVLPLRSPLQTAEDYAAVDVLSGGRLEMGVGSGYLEQEFRPLGIPLEEKTARFNEAVEVLRAAWTGGLRGGYGGRYYRYGPVQLQTGCLQKPHPPLACAILRPEAAYFVGVGGMDLLLMPYATCQDPAELQVLVERFRRGAAEVGRPGRVIATMPVYVGETEAEAEEQAGPALDLFLRTRQFARGGSFSGVRASRLVGLGTAGQVAAVVAEWRAAGVDELLAMFSFGALSHQQVAVSMERFARGVMAR